MTEIPDPQERWEAVRAAAGLGPMLPPQRIDSDSNDAWQVADGHLGDLVVRVGWRGDITRLEREVAVATHLPAAVRYPEVVGHGRAFARGHALTYTLTRRLTGWPLDRRWATLSDTQRRAAVGELAQMLRELHSWRPPAPVAEVVCQRPDLRLGTIAGLIGSDITPLPLERALALAAHSSSLPNVDRRLIAEATRAMRDLRPVDPALDNPSEHGIVHGDLHLNNLWWSEDAGLFLLDLEWVRFGPPSLELLRLCDSADEDLLRGNELHLTVLRWLAADYPRLFDGSGLLARLRLYSLAFALREINLAAPHRDDNALRRLRRLIDGTWPAAPLAELLNQ